MRKDVVWLVFFFQAEDGIRDYKVTGVQTCALPISAAATSHWPSGLAASEATLATNFTVAMPADAGRRNSSAMRARRWVAIRPGGPNKIGRASCRERV